MIQGLIRPVSIRPSGLGAYLGYSQRTGERVLARWRAEGLVRPRRLPGGMKGLLLLTSEIDAAVKALPVVE